MWRHDLGDIIKLPEGESLREVARRGAFRDPGQIGDRICWADGPENGDDPHADPGFPNRKIAHKYGANAIKLHIDEFYGFIQGIEGP